MVIQVLLLAPLSFILSLPYDIGLGKVYSRQAAYSACQRAANSKIEEVRVMYACREDDANRQFLLLKFNPLDIGDPSRYTTIEYFRY